MKKENIYSLTICLYIFLAIVTDEGAIAMKLARLLVVGVCGLKILSERSVKITPYIQRMVAFWLFAAITILWAESAEWAIGMSKTLLFNLLCMFALLNLIDFKQERLDLAMKTMVFAPLILELRVVFMGGFLAFLNARYIGDTSANTVGMCAAFGACISVYYWIQGARKYGLLFVVNSAIVLLSASKKALLCVGIPTMLVFLLDTEIPRKKRLFRCGLLLVAGLIGLWLVMHVPALYELIGRRIEGLFATLVGNTEKRDGSSFARAKLITRGLGWFRERPLLGYGIDCYRVVLVKHYPSWPIETYAHNNYVELLVDTGIIGTALYYLNYIDIACKSWKNRKRMDNAGILIACMFLTLVINEVALVSYFDKFVQILILLIWIFLGKYDRTEKKTGKTGDQGVMAKLMRVIRDPRCVLRRLLAQYRFKWLSDEAYLRLTYYAHFGKKLDLKDPKTFNEKLQWLKLYDRKPEYTRMVDKYEAKKYVADIIGEEHIIPTLGVWDDPEEIDFTELPDQFVLKTTHDSGGIVICRDKAALDVSAARKKLRDSLDKDYFYWGREWPYKNVKPRIIAEQYMVDESGTELKDYKFFAFNGEPKLLFVATDRGIDTRFDFFDMDFQHLPILNGHENAVKKIEKPKSFEQMKEFSEKLSEGIPQLRVDFYDINGHVYFGELTFYHWSGFVPFEPEEWDRRLGDLIRLPSVKSNNG